MELKVKIDKDSEHGGNGLKTHSLPWKQTECSKHYVQAFLDHFGNYVNWLINNKSKN